jgi:hypothetical protein
MIRLAEEGPLASMITGCKGVALISEKIGLKTNTYEDSIVIFCCFRDLFNRPISLTMKECKVKNKGENHSYHDGATLLVPTTDLSDSRTRFSLVRTLTRPFDPENESTTF